MTPVLYRAKTCITCCCILAIALTTGSHVDGLVSSTAGFSPWYSSLRNGNAFGRRAGRGDRGSLAFALAVGYSARFGIHSLGTLRGAVKLRNRREACTRLGERLVDDLGQAVTVGGIEELEILHPPTNASKRDTINDGIQTDGEHQSANLNDVQLTAVPPAGFSIETKPDGPSRDLVHALTVHLGAQGQVDPLVFETGRIGRQAAGAVTLTRGDTVVYATASRDDEPKDSIDFVPLSVDYQERFSSIGSTSGAYSKRDGRPAEHEILVCRLIDRPLRPLIAPGWRHETQLLSWVLSYDGQRDCGPLAMTASAASLWISDVPLLKPVAAVAVGLVDDQFVLNPTNDQLEKSRLDLTIAGSKDALLMIEGSADFVVEDIMVQAVQFGHKYIATICEGLEELAKVVGSRKKLDTKPEPPAGLKGAVDQLARDRLDAVFALRSRKKEHSAEISSLSRFVVSSLEGQFPDQEIAIRAAFKRLVARRMFILARDEGRRIDGRRLDEVRKIDISTGILPRVHGSALFTRGDTQTIATATLGDSGMKQKIDKINGLEQKRFYLQYTFPPSCVGETGRVGAPGRREVGHGNLAERALSKIIPTEDCFPYSIRVESLITESHGSSSMASVCGGCLALMDAGVPVLRPVAGIAMGMLLYDQHDISGDDALIISDILGSEDALGTMDFKVAGDARGITAFQLDIKCEGLTFDTLNRALEQARRGRLHVLNEMEKAAVQHRPELPSTVPRIISFSIPPELIGRIIGPGGKQIRAIIEDFGLTNMDVNDDGKIQISSMKSSPLVEAQTFVLNLIAGGTASKKGGRKKTYEGPPPEVGKVYHGKITGIHNFGVFLEILPGSEDGSSPGLEGLCHVSELHVDRIRNCEAYVASLGTDRLEVKYLGTNNKGQLQLSRKATMPSNLRTSTSQ